MEDRNDWSIRRLVRTADRYRVIEIQVGDHTITATNLLPDDLRTADAALIENSHTIRRLPGVFSNVAVGNQIAEYGRVGNQRIADTRDARSPRYERSNPGR